MTCPNATCVHPAEDHDHDPLFGDGLHCRHVGCWCGHRDPEASRRLDIALLAACVGQGMARKVPLGRINQC